MYIVLTSFCCVGWKAEKQRDKEAQKEKQLEERAKFIEKTKKLLVFKDDPDAERPAKKGKVCI